MPAHSVTSSEATIIQPLASSFWTSCSTFVCRLAATKGTFDQIACRTR